MSTAPAREDPLVLSPISGQHTATVIIIHGFGDSGHGWSSAVEHIRRRHDRLDDVKFILPHAPNIPLSMANGRHPDEVLTSSPGRLSSLSACQGEHVSGVLETQSYIHSLIQAETEAGIPPERIILGGFSQGGAISIFSGLTAPIKLGGIVALSCWVLLHEEFLDYIPDEDLNKDTPIFMGHGDQDWRIEYQVAIDSAELLEKAGYNIAFHRYRQVFHSARIYIYISNGLLGESAILFAGRS
uniref:Acyl-protein thioesterase 1 n=1 Tax=Bionectria ochroleuca TaxID=29856 RepID=A0A0B7KA93_BIOOC